MGFEARFQALPENCTLVIQCRQNSEVASWIQFFNMYAQDATDERPESEAEIVFYKSAMEIFQQDPTVVKRYFYAGGRNFDSILYLLSPARRASAENDTSLIAQAINGTELLHPEARSTQGFPIGFVPTHTVPVIADYLDSVTFDQLHEYYEPAKMARTVYKIWAESGENRFKSIWNEFTGIKNVYRAAADHGEAMITVID